MEERTQVVGLFRPGPRCRVLGVLNVTEDSFSDGGRYLDPERALAQGLAMTEAGADVIDVGGESTRPGAVRVPAEVEEQRVAPVIRELSARGIVTTVDTMRASTARRALEAGAFAINDVSGGLADPNMVGLVAEAGCPWILMHWRASTFGDAAGNAHDGEDIVAAVREDLARRVDEVLAAGVSPEQIILDPGLGFAKSRADDWELVRRLNELVALGFPVLVAASRKRFLGALLAADGDAAAVPPRERDHATAALSALAADRGAWGVRVHTIAPSADAVRVAAALRPGARIGAGRIGTERTGTERAAARDAATIDTAPDGTTMDAAAASHGRGGRN